MSDKVSDTPRTDAFEAEHWYVDANSTAYALWEYARTLERENAKLAAEVERLKRGEFICQKCGLRKDGESEPADF